jgi:hypothetical protein
MILVSSNTDSRCREQGKEQGTGSRRAGSWETGAGNGRCWDGSKEPCREQGAGGVMCQWLGLSGIGFLDEKETVVMQNTRRPSIRRRLMALRSCDGEESNSIISTKRIVVMLEVLMKRASERRKL